MLCSIGDLKKKNESRAVWHGVATFMSKVTHMLHCVNGVDTTDIYVLLVRFALAYFKKIMFIHTSPISCDLGTS